MVVSHVSPHNGQQVFFPRPLSAFERETLLWLLPAERPGYNEYRKYITEWAIVGEGRRGTGNYILAEKGVLPDVESPLPQVFAYGVIEAEHVTISATLRELFEDQLEYEIVNLNGETIPESFAERRRWNFSLWLPAHPCPACGSKLREVTIRRESGGDATLAVCAADKRLWIFDSENGVNHLMPVTNFHNALMLQKNIRDPETALAAENFFRQLHTFSDMDLGAAFVQYNKLRKKIELGRVIMPGSKKMSLVDKVYSLFKK
ncbi:MAG: hypothetical protein WBZ48_01970 [Bacteroidota bacterium]